MVSYEANKKLLIDAFNNDSGSDQDTIQLLLKLTLHNRRLEISGGIAGLLRDFTSSNWPVFKLPIYVRAEAFSYLFLIIPIIPLTPFSIFIFDAASL